MADNPQEQTEAKLLAYIEGELDDLGRAEIERHIESNPKHRKLLNELSTGRRLVRMLPRESAPVELFENVQSQLERQELLSSVADVNTDNGTIRLSRWGQLRAAAAVLLLATGLGVIVYNMLPKQGSGNLAVRPAQTSPDGETNPSEVVAIDPVLAGGVPRTPPLSLTNPSIDGSSPVAVADAAGLDTLRLSRMANAADAARKLPAVREALGSPSVLEIDPVDRSAESGAPPADSGASGMEIAGKGSAEGFDPARRGAAFKRGADTFSRSGQKSVGNEDAMYLVVASSDLTATRNDLLVLLAETGLPYRQVSQQLQGAASMPAGGQGIGSGLARGQADDQSDPEAAQNRQAAFAGSGQQPAPNAGEAETVEHRSLELANTQSAQENVLVVRRVPRRQASELIRSLHRPSADRFAMAYASTALEAGKSGLTAMSAAKDQASLNESPAQEFFADRKVPVASGGSGAGANLSSKQGIGPQADLGRPQVAVGTRTAPRAIASAATPGTATQPVSRQRLATPPAAINVDKAKNAAPAMKPGQIREAADQTRPFVPNETIELVYRDMRLNNQPLARPMRISARGTIFVAGYGEFPLVGLSPADATAKLTAAVQARSPASKGVEVRRAIVATEPLAAAEPAAAPSQAALPRAAGPATDESRRDEFTTRPRPAPTGTLRTETAAPTRPPQPSTPATPSPEGAPVNTPNVLHPTQNPESAPAAIAQQAPMAEQEDFIDLVIVLQQDLAGAEKR